MSANQVFSFYSWDQEAERYIMNESENNENLRMSRSNSLPLISDLGMHQDSFNLSSMTLDSFNVTGRNLHHSRVNAESDGLSTTPDSGFEVTGVSTGLAFDVTGESSSSVFDAFGASSEQTSRDNTMDGALRCENVLQCTPAEPRLRHSASFTTSATAKPPGSLKRNITSPDFWRHFQRDQSVMPSTEPALPPGRHEDRSDDYHLASPTLTYELNVPDCERVGISPNSSIEYNRTDPYASTVTSSNVSGGTFNLYSFFLNICDQLTRTDGSEFDGIHSPRRLYNRRSEIFLLPMKPASPPTCVEIETGFNPSATSSPNKANPSTRNVKNKTDESQCSSYQDSLVRRSRLSTSASEFIPTSTQLIQASASTVHVINGRRYEILNPNFCQTQSHLQVPRNFLTSSMERINNHLRRFDFTEGCVYCKRTGMDFFMVSSHCIRNPISKKIMCPRLEKVLCKICGDSLSDNLVHSTSECPNQT